MRTRVCMLMWISVAVMALGSPHASAQPVQKSAYRALQADRLTNVFIEMQMLDVQERFIQQQAKAGADQMRLNMLMAGLQRSRARTEETDAARYALLDEALALYAAVIEELDPDKMDFVGKVEKYELKHEWAWLTIDTRGAQYLLPIRDLRASDADKMEFVALIEEPVWALEELQIDIAAARTKVSSAGGGSLSSPVPVWRIFRRR